MEAFRLHEAGSRTILEQIQDHLNRLAGESARRDEKMKILEERVRWCEDIIRVACSKTVNEKAILDTMMDLKKQLEETTK